MSLKTKYLSTYFLGLMFSAPKDQQDFDATKQSGEEFTLL